MKGGHIVQAARLRDRCATRSSLGGDSRLPVQCRHVERCRGGSLLDEATDMESVRIRRSMDDLMDRTWNP